MKFNITKCTIECEKFPWCTTIRFHPKNYYPKYENIDKLYNKINNLLHNLDTSTKYKEITLDYNAINTKYI